MGQEVNVNVTEVNLLNDKNQITVEVLLESIWENVRQFPYLYIKAEVSIPIIESSQEMTLVFTIQEEFDVSSISEDTKTVVLNGEFLGKVNTDKDVKGISNVYGYNKISQEA